MLRPRVLSYIRWYTELLPVHKLKLAQWWKKWRRITINWSSVLPTIIIRSHVLFSVSNVLPFVVLVAKVVARIGPNRHVIFGSCSVPMWIGTGTIVTTAPSLLVGEWRVALVVSVDRRHSHGTKIKVSF